MKYANDKNFDEVISKEKVTLVDFFATWCMPCKMQSQVLEKIANSRAYEFDIVKVNVDESPELASKFDISSIPTLVVLKDGIVKKRSVGFSQEKEVLSMMEDID